VGQKQDVVIHVREFASLSGNAPVISDIPDQTIDEGKSFTNIFLDDFIEDVDHADAEIFRTTSGSVHLSVTITNRIASISTPNENWNGTEVITFIASAPYTFTADSAVFTVTSVNDPPVAQNQTVSTLEDVPIAITLAATDIDSTALTYEVITPTSSGNISGTPPQLLYSPDKNWSGTDQIVFQVNDGELKSNEATVDIQVQAVNDPPTVESETFDLTEDTMFSNTLKASDPENDALTLHIVSPAQHGTLEIMNESMLEFQYTPEKDYVGTDAFEVKINDGKTDSQTAVISLNILEVNDPPVLPDTQFSTFEDHIKSYTLVAFDQDSGSLSYSLVELAIKGTVSLNQQTGTLTYTPLPDENGNDLFTVIAKDENSQSPVASVSVWVTPVNDPPVAPIQSVMTNEDEPITITLEATDIDSTSLTYEIITPTSSGNISGTPPQFVYSPDENWSGTDQLVFQVNDGELKSNKATVDINVQAVNDPPTVESETFDLTEDTMFSNTLKASDPENDALTLHIVSPAQHGTLEIMNESMLEFQYTPEKDYVGTDAFEVKVNDGKTDSQTAVISLNILEINDPPTISDIADQTISEDTTSPPIELTVNDIESSNLSVSVYSTNQSVIPDNRLSVAGVGTNRNLVISPIANQTGQTIIRLTVSDAEGLTAQTEFMLVVIESSNIAPDTPSIASSIVLIDNTDETVIFRANPFNDPDDNEQPIKTLCRIGRMDRPGKYLLEEIDTYESLLNDGYQEYPFDASELKSGLQYYFQIAFNYTGGQTEWSSRHTFLVGDNAPVNDPAIPVGDTQSHFEMISFTHFFPDSSGKAVLQNTLGDYDTTIYRIGTYDPTYVSGDYREYNNDLFTIEPGRSYWFLSRNAVDINTKGVSASINTDIDIQLLYNEASENGGT